MRREKGKREREKVQTNKDIFIKSLVRERDRERKRKRAREKKSFSPSPLSLTLAQGNSERKDSQTNGFLLIDAIYYRLRTPRPYAVALSISCHHSIENAHVSSRTRSLHAAIGVNGGQRHGWNHHVLRSRTCRLLLAVADSLLQHDTHEQSSIQFVHAGQV